MGKLFGTDGIRGVVNRDLDAELAFRVGLAAALVVEEEKQAPPRFTIGKDTRISSDLLEAALIAGLCSAGANVLTLGVLPTPAVAFLTKENEADAGIVVSASHNPYEHNGIKLFDSAGYKLSEALEARIEALVLSDAPLPRKRDGDLGRCIHAGKDQCRHYVSHLLATIPEDGVRSLRVAVDCANGAASTTAPALFSQIAMDTDIYYAEPDGVNINSGCGSTHLESLCAIVREGDYDLGLAFDGDADRCLAVDERGGIVDGDRIMALCAQRLRQEGKLPENTVVATTMSNLGFHAFAREKGLRLVCTDVGDRNVLERMRESGFSLGGEQSGHMIFQEHATTGDGQLAALQLLYTVCAAGKPLSELAGEVPWYPQVLVNVPAVDKEKKARVMKTDALAEAIGAAERALGAEGRVLVRPSGTEPFIRVMVEAAEQETALRYAQNLADLIKNMQE